MVVNSFARDEITRCTSIVQPGKHPPFRASAKYLSSLRERYARISIFLNLRGNRARHLHRRKIISTASGFSACFFKPELDSRLRGNDPTVARKLWWAGSATSFPASGFVRMHPESERLGLRRTSRRAGIKTGCSAIANKSF